MKNYPPRWAVRFLRWFCREDYLDEIEGDLFELFYHRSSNSKWKATAFFLWNVIRSLRWENLKQTNRMKSGLVRNYFKVGIRTLVRDRQFTLINLFGLSLALAVVLTITLLVKHEASFDSFHTKADRIYQVIQEFENADGLDPEIWTSMNLSEALRNDLDIVENAVTIHAVSSTWTTAAKKRFFEEDGIIAGPQFLEIFDFELVDGNRSMVLEGRRSMVMTESLARKYFDGENPIGKEVDLESYGRFEVTGVMKDVPDNSYIQFDFIITQDYDVFLETVRESFRDYFFSWTGDPVATYVLLKDSNDEKLFESKVASMLAKYLPEEDINRHYLLGMLDLHFHSHGIDGRINQYVKGDLDKVRFLVLVAIIILTMACFNYISISTARYIKRTKEVGIRKAMGAYKKQVTFQFLIESFIMVFVSAMIGMVVTHYLLPYFYMLTGIQLEMTTGFLVDLIPFFMVIVFVVTLLAGFYPAFHLSRYSIVNVLKNLTVYAGGNNSLRRGLLVLQYSTVVIILAGLIIVNQQYSFMSNKSLGFNTEQLVIVEINSGETRVNYENIKNELLTIPDVTNVTGVTRMPGGYRSGTAVESFITDEPEKNLPMKFYGMDENGLSALGIDVVAGQPFSEIKGQERLAVWINETAAEAYGGNDVIGKMINLREVDGNAIQMKVAGVVKDFHYRSFRKSIGPVVIGHYKNPFVGLDDIVIQLSGFNTIETLEKIEAVHNQYDVNKVMTWEFMDDMVQREYEKELIFRNIFVGASIISFCIALLGMIGLSSYNVISKRKEIAIRKILGAGFLSLINQHAREFVRYLLIATLVAIPLSWWLASSWLRNFEYRIDVSPLIFIGVLLFLTIITFAVILFVGNKTIKANPVDSIRYE